jgi:hypothetical protein
MVAGNCIITTYKTSLKADKEDWGWGVDEGYNCIFLTCGKDPDAAETGMLFYEF